MGHVPISAILERNDTLTIPHKCLGKKTPQMFEKKHMLDRLDPAQVWSIFKSSDTRIQRGDIEMYSIFQFNKVVTLDIFKSTRVYTFGMLWEADWTTMWLYAVVVCSLDFSYFSALLHTHLEHESDPLKDFTAKADVLCSLRFDFHAEHVWALDRSGLPSGTERFRLRDSVLGYVQLYENLKENEKNQWCKCPIIFTSSFHCQQNPWRRHQRGSWSNHRPRSMRQPRGRWNWSWRRRTLRR